MPHTLHLGDCLDILRTMPDNSVDAVVTDPPYGLSFMGKRWDYDVPSKDIWRECLRVLKPGGHLLAFAGTRTQHRMAVRIEDAGFEIRDMIAWVYGSGFPKSLDVSKAIDKMDASEEQQARRYRFTAWVRSQGVTSKQIDEATATNMGGHYTTSASQPAIMTREHLEQCRHLFQDIPSWVEAECDKRSVESRNFAEREVVRKQTVPSGHAFAGEQYGGSTDIQINITAPATPAARQWHGWGTALKPALEPITVARKPLIGTVAENVLTWGTGGVNVDGCRVGTEEVKVKETVKPRRQSSGIYGDYNETLRFNGNGTSNPLGRWPANLIHDGSEEVVGLFPDSQGMQRGRLRRGATTGRSIGGKGRYGEAAPQEVEAGYNDSGSAARFFYCAKASKRDRDEGCEGMPQVMAMRYGEKAQGPLPQQTPSKPVAQRNHHPTVKPTDLMRYLCRLVTPPEGTVLDPFMGSGSTGKAAILEGFNFIGIEREPEYLEIARARITHAQEQKDSKLL